MLELADDISHSIIIIMYRSVRKYRNFGRIRRVIVRAGVGVNFREPPDEIGRVFFLFFFVYIMQKQTIANSGVPV